MALKWLFFSEKLQQLPSSWELRPQVPHSAELGVSKKIAGRKKQILQPKFFTLKHKAQSPP